jgi:hypothetical protein
VIFASITMIWMKTHRDARHQGLHQAAGACMKVFRQVTTTFISHMTSIAFLSPIEPSKTLLGATIPSTLPTYSRVAHLHQTCLIVQNSINDCFGGNAVKKRSDTSLTDSVQPILVVCRLSWTSCMPRLVLALQSAISAI